MKCDHNDQCLKIKSLKEKYKTRQNKHWPLKDIEVRSGAMERNENRHRTFYLREPFLLRDGPF